MKSCVSDIATPPPLPLTCFLIPPHCWQGSIIAGFLSGASSHGYQKKHNSLAPLVNEDALISLVSYPSSPPRIKESLGICIRGNGWNISYRATIKGAPSLPIPALLESKSLFVFVSGEMDETFPIDPKGAPLMVCSPPHADKALESPHGFFPYPTKTLSCFKPSRKVYKMYGFMLLLHLVIVNCQLHKAPADFLHILLLADPRKIFASLHNFLAEFWPTLATYSSHLIFSQ